MCVTRARTRRLVVAELLGEREQLVHPRELALEVVGAGGRDPALVEDEGERRRVAEAAGDRDGLVDERVAAVGLLAPVDRDGEAHEQPRPQRAGRPASTAASASSSTPTSSSSTIPGERPKPPRLSAARPSRSLSSRLLGERDGLEQAVARGVLARVHLRLAAREHELAAALLVGLGVRSRTRSAASKRSAACS